MSKNSNQQGTLAFIFVLATSYVFRSLSNGVYWNAMEIALTPVQFGMLHGIADVVGIVLVPALGAKANGRAHWFVKTSYVVWCVITPLTILPAGIVTLPGALAARVGLILVLCVGASRRLSLAGTKGPLNRVALLLLSEPDFRRYILVAPVLEAGTDYVGGKIGAALMPNVVLAYVIATLLAIAALVAYLALPDSQAIRGEDTASNKWLDDRVGLALGFYVVYQLGAYGLREALAKLYLIEYGVSTQLLPDFRFPASISQVVIGIVLTLAAGKVALPYGPLSLWLYATMFTLGLLGVGTTDNFSTATSFKVLEGMGSYLLLTLCIEALAGRLSSFGFNLLWSVMAVVSVAIRFVSLSLLLPRYGAAGTSIIICTAMALISAALLTIWWLPATRPLSERIDRFWLACLSLDAFDRVKRQFTEVSVRARNVIARLLHR